MKNYNKLTVDDLQKQAHMTFCDKLSIYSTILPVNFTIETLSPATDTGDIIIFHRRTKSAMISKRIKGSITTSSWKSLILRKDKFSWTSTTTNEVNFDGPTMIYFLVSTLNLSTRVGVTEFKNEIQNARLDKYDQNLKEMLDNTQDNYGHTTDLDQTHQDYMMHLFDALLSSRNDVFNAYIQCRKYHWEEGGSLTHDTLIVNATTKYNNMMKKNKWKQSESKEAKIIAFTTRLNALESNSNSNNNRRTGRSTFNTQGNDNDRKRFLEWRLTKTKYTLERDGKKWYWCTKYGKDGQIPMYVTHHYGDHDQWLENKRNWNKNKPSNESSNPTDSKPTKTLSLANNMRAVIVAKFSISETKVDSLLTEIEDKSKN